MGRRRKTDNAAGGVILLLGIAIMVAILMIRLAITVIFFAAAPILLITWLSTFQTRSRIKFRNPKEFDDDISWRQICDLLSERQRLFSRMHQTYAVGFENNLTVTAKSDGRLFHAGSRLGKQLNADLDSMYRRADAISFKMKELRLQVLQKIPNWRAPFNTYIQTSKLHYVSGLVLVILSMLSITLHAITIVSSELVDSAANALLWNPDPSDISGDLVISCGMTTVVGLLIWIYKTPPSLTPVDLSIYEEWQSVEDKWSEPLERASLKIQEHLSSDRSQNQKEPERSNCDLPWFEVLDVNEYATAEDIKRAYREAMRQYHPDKVSGLGERLQRVAEEESKKINAAFSQAKQKRGFA